MILTFVYVIYALVAIAMVALILMQRGAGAAAGSGFGGGASATVFGARGSSNFLSKATKWLAVVFFAIALGLAVYASKPHAVGPAAADLGLMGKLPTAPAGNGPPVGSAIPVVPTQSAPAPAPASAVPILPMQAPPASAMPASTSPKPSAPAPDNKGG